MATIADISDVLLDLGLADAATDTERAIAANSLTKAEGAVKRFLKYNPVLATRTEFYPQQDYRRVGRQFIWDVNDINAFQRRVSEASTTELQLLHVPVRSITQLFLDFDGRSGTQTGAFGPGTLQVEGQDYWPNFDQEDSAGNSICVDGIIRSEGLWPDVTGTVKVIYIAGYTQDEFRGQAENSAGDNIIDASPILDAVVDEATRRALKAFVRAKNNRIGFSGGPFMSERMGDYSYKLDTDAINRLVGGTMDILPETEQKLQDFLNYGVMAL